MVSYFPNYFSALESRALLDLVLSQLNNVLVLKEEEEKEEKIYKT
jgi:hypothetical protein